MGEHLMSTIEMFLNRILGLTEEVPKILYTGPRRDYAVKIVSVFLM